MNERGKPTKREFLKWRSPVRGKKNPQRMDNPLWHWCIRNPESSAYDVARAYDGPDSMGSGPCWCFDRMGQATIRLPDGRIVHVGGEHEDYYDPDFYIYNDVVVVDGDKVQIFGYPESVFPPTDFHTGTHVNNDIILIGNLGYPDDRAAERIQVFRLKTESWQMVGLESTGDDPGWIHMHSAAYSSDENAITISGGLRYGDRILENFDDYKLCLDSLVWTKLTDRKWDRWILEREDGEASQLWAIRSSSQMRDVGFSMEDQFKEMASNVPVEELSELFPKVSSDQMDQIKTLYQSPFSVEVAVGDEEIDSRYRLEADGVTVRFDEELYGITMTVEGRLSRDKINAILSSLQARLSAVEGIGFTVSPIEA